MHSLIEPQSYKEAIASPQWQLTIANKLPALQKSQTQDIIPLPPRKHTIGRKWFFKTKTKSDGSNDRYKGRLIAKGYNQEYGVDYEETFAPVAKMTMVRTFIYVAATRQWVISQLDVKKAYLNGFYPKKYMTSPA